jgi:hypothetical protein
MPASGMIRIAITPAPRLTDEHRAGFNIMISLALFKD